MSPVFLLSPADCTGKRARLLLRPDARFDLAVRVSRRPGAPLGEVFAFVSGLYFRGKLAYARAFADPAAEESGVLVIVPGRGLVPAGALVTRADLRRTARVGVDPGDPRYLRPLLRDARTLRDRLDGLDRLARGAVRTRRKGGREETRGEVVLLGSIATGKYADPLLSVLGDRLRFPADFVGRGDMSRGGLLLRRARSGEPLEYVRLRGATVRGVRPPRLAPQGRVG